MMFKVDKSELDEAYLNASTTFQAIISHDVWCHEESVLQLIEVLTDCVSIYNDYDLPSWMSIGFIIYDS